jgi:ribosomal protein S6E (S10)
MKRLLCFFIFSSLLLLQNTAATVDEMRNMNIPIVVINTINKETPTCDYAHAPEGQDGITSINHTKVSARMYIIQQNDTLYDSGEYVDGISGLTIRIRGNTSAYGYPMKPYKLNLQKKADLLLRGDKKYNDKDWLLLNDYKLNTIVGNKVSELVGFLWHPKFEYVNFFLNNDYQGLYLLSESIKRNPDCRIDVSKEEGYIFENDAYWWNESVYADTHIINPRYNYTFKYPDSDKMTEEQVNYIMAVMDDVETSILDGTYPDKIDVESFTKWLLVNNIIGSYDSGGSNMYLTKYDNTSKVSMSCPWDFSGMMMYGNYSRYNEMWASIQKDNIFYYPYLISSSNKTFHSVYVKLWDSIKDMVFVEIDNFLADLRNSPQAESLNACRKSMTMKWYGKDSKEYKNSDIYTEIDGMREWFNGRKIWLDENTSQVFTSILNVKDESTKPNTIYDIQGKKVPTMSQNGLYILNKKKIIHRK